MARKPQSVSWLGFSTAQTELRDFLDHVGNNGWARNSQTEALMPGLLGDLEQSGLPLVRVKEEMMSLGYGKDARHEIDR